MLQDHANRAGTGNKCSKCNIGVRRAVVSRFMACPSPTTLQHSRTMNLTEIVTQLHSERNQLAAQVATLTPPGQHYQVLQAPQHQHQYQQDVTPTRFRSQASCHTSSGTSETQGGMSAAGRAALVAAQKARWAAYHKARLLVNLWWQSSPRRRSVPCLPPPSQDRRGKACMVGSEKGSEGVTHSFNQTQQEHSMDCQTQTQCRIH